MQNFERRVDVLGRELGILEFQYNGGMWCVKTSMGNLMVVVPGTLSTTIEGALRKAEQRWANRDESHPFLW